MRAISSASTWRTTAQVTATVLTRAGAVQRTARSRHLSLIGLIVMFEVHGADAHALCIATSQSRVSSLNARKSIYRPLVINKVISSTDYAPWRARC